MVRFALPILLAFAGPVAAQSACGADPTAWLAENGPAMDGFWTDDMMVFIMNGEAMPTNPPEVVPVATIPGGLRVEALEGEITYDLMLTDRGFDLEPPPGVLPVTGAEFELLAFDCPVDQLPRLLSQQQVVLDGLPVQLTVSGVIADTQTIHLFFNMEMSFGTIQQYSVMSQ